jgi:glycosyltransferase involved in cell wall biosynthesis
LSGVMTSQETTDIANALLKRRPLRVLMIVGGFPIGDSTGGTFNYYAARAVSSVADVQVLYMRAWKPGRKPLSRTSLDGIKVTVTAAPLIPGYRPMNRWIYRLLAWPMVRPLVADADVVHSVDASGSGIDGSDWSRRAGVAHVTQVTGGDVHTTLPKYGRSRFIAGWNKHVQGVACNSNELRSSFLQLYPGTPNVRVIHRGVDLNRFSPNGEQWSPFEGRRGTKYVYVGGFPNYADTPAAANTKGGLTLIEAWRQAETELHALDSTLVVAGPDADGDIATRAVQTLRYPDNVHVMGFVDHRKLPALLRGADVVIVPSLEEGLPNIAMEASATERPVFGTLIPGTIEVVEDGRTGILLRPGDAVALARLLVANAGRPATLLEMGRRARQRMETEFDQRNFGPQMLDLYLAAMAQHGTSMGSGHHHAGPER